MAACFLLHLCFLWIFYKSLCIGVKSEIQRNATIKIITFRQKFHVFYRRTGCAIATDSTTLRSYDHLRCLNIWSLASYLQSVNSGKVNILLGYGLCFPCKREIFHVTATNFLLCIGASHCPLYKSIFKVADPTSKGMTWDLFEIYQQDNFYSAAKLVCFLWSYRKCSTAHWKSKLKFLKMSRNLTFKEAKHIKLCIWW